jgi:hypothetical protein
MPDLFPVAILFDGTGEPDPYQFNSQFIQRHCADKGIALTVSRKRLRVGDYTISGFEDQFTVERKKIDDLTGRLSQPSKRKLAGNLTDPANARPARNKRAEFFSRQVEPMAQMEAAAIVLEANWSDLTWHRYRSEIHPNSVKSTIAAIIAQSRIPVLALSDRADAEQMTFLLLLKWLRKFHPAFALAERER